MPVDTITDAHDTLASLRTEREVDAEQDLNTAKFQLQNMLSLGHSRRLTWVPDADMPADALAKLAPGRKRDILRKLMDGRSWVPSEWSHLALGRDRGILCCLSVELCQDSVEAAAGSWSWL